MKIAIIGAGIGGMAAAWDFVRAGHTPTIYESTNFVGGLASGFKAPHWDWSVEKFYHHWFQSDAHMLGLINELGLNEKVLFPRPYTVLNHNGKWYPFDSILNALRYPGLGWGLNKLRFGLVGLYLRTTNNWRALEQHTVETWMRKWAGDRVYEQMWQPLLIGKFGPFYKDVNMAWMWARLKARTTRLGTYQGGFQQFSDDFAEKLRGMGVTFALETPISKIHPDPAGGVTIHPTNQAPVTFDQVLVTTSPGQLAQLAPALPPTYLAGLQALKHMGAVVLVLSLKHQLSEQGYYWFNIPKNLGYPFLAVVEHTNFVSPAHFGGEHILYCGDYLPIDHPYFSLSKEELLAQFLPGKKAAGSAVFALVAALGLWLVAKRHLFLVDIFWIGLLSIGVAFAVAYLLGSDDTEAAWLLEELDITGESV
ncbi:MAG: FAD-dependent oxidoreductase [Anaerolineales bacterium]|nr:FAD-dependent oxidoreductase [Anaerolineales bacterium]